MGKIWKNSRWVPHELNDGQMEKRKNTRDILLTQYKRMSFLHRIVTGDEKWIYFVNSKRKKLWLDPHASSTSTARPNRFGKKAMLCVSWDQRSVVCYELLKLERSTFYHFFEFNVFFRKESSFYTRTPGSWWMYFVVYTDSSAQRNAKKRTVKKPPVHRDTFVERRTLLVLNKIYHSGRCAGHSLENVISRMIPLSEKRFYSRMAWMRRSRNS